MDAAGRPEVFRMLLALGAVLVMVLAVVLRRLSRRAALDEAEETLRAEYDRLPLPGERKD
jgi:flagellar biogenesis protein FliO